MFEQTEQSRFIKVDRWVLPIPSWHVCVLLTTIRSSKCVRWKNRFFRSPIVLTLLIAVIFTWPTNNSREVHKKMVERPRPFITCLTIKVSYWLFGSCRVKPKPISFWYHLCAQVRIGTVENQERRICKYDKWGKVGFFGMFDFGMFDFCCDFNRSASDWYENENRVKREHALVGWTMR